MYDIIISSGDATTGYIHFPKIHEKILKCECNIHKRAYRRITKCKQHVIAKVGCERFFS